MINFKSRILFNKHVIYIFAVVLLGTATDVKFDIPELNGENYKVWKERVLL